MAVGRAFGLSRLDHNRAPTRTPSLRCRSATTPGTPATSLLQPAIAWHTDGYYNARTGRSTVCCCTACGRPSRAGEPAARPRDRLHPAARPRPGARRGADAGRRHDHPGERFGRPDPARVHARPGLRRARRPLHMRYTARKRNVIWRDDPQTQAAVRALEEVLGGDEPLAFEATLQGGWGLLSNNVLHTRSGFEEGSRRLLYRAAITTASPWTDQRWQRGLKPPAPPCNHSSASARSVAPLTLAMP